MKSSPSLMRLYVGALLLLGGAVTAWSASRSEFPIDPSPMEDLLAKPGSAAAVKWDIPVTRNERVEDWIDFLQNANSAKTRLWLERSGKYAPMIRAELRRRGMPEDLVYLALIESGFSPRATSSAAAAGIWQFIAETGRHYGLSVTSEVDERRDPVKATSAALDYLQELHDRFGSWYLAAAAYNTGENRVERVLREQAGGSRGNDSLFWRIAPYLPEETRNYVPLMLAAGHIAKEPEKYGFGDLEYQQPYAYEIAWVPGATDLSLIAQAAGVEREKVLDLNPQLTREHTPSGRGWPVRLPAGTATAFRQGFPRLYRLALASGASASTQASLAPTGRIHRIRRGETLGGIARNYGITVSALRAVNGNVQPRRLKPGRTLRLPSASTTRVAHATTRVAHAATTSASPRTVRAHATTRSSPHRTARARLHTVRRGENLSVIAARYDVSVKQLRRWNSLGSRSRIFAGQKLRITA